MAFVTSLDHEYFPIERQTGAGRLVPRIIVLFPDGTLVVCKSSGAITRLVHINTITHLNYAVTHQIQGCLVHIRFERDHDLLFSHLVEGNASAAPSHSNVERRIENTSPTRKTRNDPVMASRLGPDSLILPFEVASVLKVRAACFIRKLLEIRNGSPVAEPLEATLRHSADLMRERADLAKSPSFVVPQACHPVTSDTLYIPTIFRPLEIRASAILNMATGGAYHRSCHTLTPAFVDTSFLTLLKFAIEANPTCSLDPPLARVEAPAPHKSVIEVSDRFLAAFTEAYVSELPLCVNVHTGTARPRSFRASEEFWSFIQRRSQIQRPTNDILLTLASTHVEVYVVGREHQMVAMPVGQWNVLISRWEQLVRRGSREGDALEKSGAPPLNNRTHLDSDEQNASLLSKHTEFNTDAYWEAFVNEIERYERFGM